MLGRLNFEAELRGIECGVDGPGKSKVNMNIDVAGRYGDSNIFCELIAQHIDEIGVDGLAFLDGEMRSDTTRRHIYDDVDGTISVKNLNNTLVNSLVA